MLRGADGPRVEPGTLLCSWVYVGFYVFPVVFITDRILYLVGFLFLIIGVFAFGCGPGPPAAGSARAARPASAAWIAAGDSCGPSVA